MNKESLVATTETVPSELVDSMTEYIRYGSVDDVLAYAPLADQAWHDMAVKVTDYTRSLGRVLTHDEMIELFSRASQQAFDEHQQTRLPDSSELLAVPAKFLDPKVVSEEGWAIIGHLYRHRAGTSRLIVR